MILSGIVAGLLIASAIYAFTGFSLFGSPHRKTVSADDAAGIDIITLAYNVLEYIKDDDFYSLSQVVHPEYGVIFSPSATINLTTDRRFNSEQIAALGTDSNIYVWGVYNGSGVPIELSPADYFSEFIPAVDHMKTVVIGVNQIVRSGNALENINDVFPNGEFIDFFNPGGELTDELDWSSLRLVFEEYNGYLKLVAIIFSKRTV